MSAARKFVIGGGLVTVLSYLGYNKIIEPENDQAKPLPAPSVSVQEAARIGQFDARHPVVELVTSLGNIQLQLKPEQAPITVGNFLSYVERGHYNGTIIHELHPNFIAIAGGYTPELREKQGDSPIPCEAHNGLRNRRYTVSMARLPNAIDSATSQFFFNLNDNSILDHRGLSPDQYGFCVFGEVIAGQTVVDQLNQQRGLAKDSFISIPQQSIAIKSARRIR